MTENIIALREDQSMIELKNKLTSIESIINDKEQELAELKRELWSAETAQEESTGEDKKTLRIFIKNQKEKIKILEQSLKLEESTRDNLQRDISALEAQRNKVFVTKNTNESVLKTFQDNNIHYVINGRKWWRVEQDSTGGIRIKDHDYMELKDLVFYSTDWEIKDEMEVKRFAKENNRFFKDIVRDFTTRNVAGVYNQMDDIRRYWLKPVFDQDPHIAFLLLTLSIAGGSEEYSDQLERLIAYRYCHPEDVMVPNIDSCATGGTGRDTLFGIIRTIFTDECCATISEETISGTHNGDLFGKMWVKVSEKDSRVISIDKIKDLTGDRKYRHRAMGMDARDAVRLFNFLFFRNGYTTTAKLSGTGSSGEDRRFEPIIARVNLARYVAWNEGWINDLDQMLTQDQEQQAVAKIKEWQRDVYNNREEIARWLGYIIRRHNAEQMRELTPIHGAYYQEMLMRQRKGIDIFMPKFMALFEGGESTVISVKDAHKLYEVAENAKVTKDWFKNQLMYWLNSKMGWDSVEEQDDIYPFEGATSGARRRYFVVLNRLTQPAKRVFNIEDFIDPDALDDKGNTVGEKINQYSIKDELK